ncbi:MAG: hypothetical protein FJZ96_03750 [Chloroflexi bacterium]|nr:hypothetical protein [Chloroflexota bacterium]
MRAHSTLARLVSTSLALSLALSCLPLSSTTTGTDTPGGEIIEVPLEGEEFEYSLPDEISMESAAETEIQALRDMTAAISAQVGTDLEPVLDLHLANRQEIFQQILDEAATSQLPVRKVGLAKPAPSGNYQTALIATIFTVFLTIGMMPAHAQGSGTILDETKTVGDSSAQIKLTFSTSGSRITAEGTVTMTTSKDGATLTEKARIKATAEACPDANGNAPVELDMQWDMTGSNAGKTGGTQIYANGKVTSNVDDNAEISGTDFDLTSGYAEQKMGSQGGQVVGKFAEVRFQGHVSSQEFNNRSKLTMGRTGGQADASTVINAAKSLKFGFLVGAMILSVAKDKWSNGFCLELIVEGVQDNNLVDLDSTTTFIAKVRHKFEGTEMNLPVTASLSGEESVDPTAKTNAPVNYTYVAGDKPDATATVALETRSKRGVAQKSISFTTGKLNWRPVTDVIPWQGQVCNLNWPFTITRPKTTMYPIAETYVFTPDDIKDLQGTVSLTQDIGQGCEVKGTGTYVITLYESEETQADIRIIVELTMYCPEFSANTGTTDLHILLEPFLDPSCRE